MVHATVEGLEDFPLQPFLSVSVGMIAGLTPACVTLPPNESLMLIPNRLSKPLSPTGTLSCPPRLQLCRAGVVLSVPPPVNAWVLFKMQPL